MRPEERFPKNRTASIGSCVGPAVMRRLAGVFTRDISAATTDRSGQPARGKPRGAKTAGRTVECGANSSV